MDNNYIPLNRLPLGARAKVKDLVMDGMIRRRMLDLGLISGTEIEALQKSPSGDPTAYHIRGAVIALRSEEAGKILVQKGEAENGPHQQINRDRCSGIRIEN